MSTIKSFLQRLFSQRAYHTVCDACSYYDDGIVDDHNAFKPHVTTKRGWISNYVRERLHV